MRQYLPVEISKLLNSTSARLQGKVTASSQGLIVQYRGQRQALPRDSSQIRTRVARSR